MRYFIIFIVIVCETIKRLSLNIKKGIRSQKNLYRVSQNPFDVI